MTLVQRENLDRRLTLSKSALTSAEICPSKRWQSKWYPRPWIPAPRMVFGSCVDAGVEILAKYASMGQEPDFSRVQAACLEVAERDGVEIDQDEAIDALLAFQAVVIPAFDWHLVRTQAHITVRMPDWGEVDSHPDLILSNHSVWDVKTSAKPKQTARTIELTFYALLVEEEAGEQVPEVGYLNFVRASGGGYWQGFGPDALHEEALKSGPNKGQMTTRGHAVPQTYVDDELRRWGRERVSAFVRADRTDDFLNEARRKAGLEPLNYSFPGGPMNNSMCLDCQFSPLLGGACQLAPRGVTEEGSDAA